MDGYKRTRKEVKIVGRENTARATTDEQPLSATLRYDKLFNWTIHRIEAPGSLHYVRWMDSPKCSTLVGYAINWVGQWPEEESG